MPTDRIIWLAIWAFITALAFVLAYAEPAPAHQAPSGWSYPWECCSGMDCAPVEADAVQTTPQGYFVTIMPGTHPQWPASQTRPITFLIPYAKGRASPDGHYHICFRPDGTLLCFYATVGGF